MDIQQNLTAFAMLGATWVMWLLVILSVIGLAIVIERILFFLATRDDLASLRETVMKKLGASDVAGATKALNESKSFEGRIALAGLSSHQDGVDAAEERIAGEAALSRVSMERNLAYLGTVGNNAPFVGLLGTVIGIIKSFQALQASQAQVSPDLMQEIGEALVATAIGLLVALPAVAFFNTFQRVIKTRLARADALAREVLAFMKTSGSGAPKHSGDQAEAAE